MTLLLGGCNLIRTMLPRHGTTTSDVQTALKRCGIALDGIAWSVSPEGILVIGRQSTDLALMPVKRSDCLMRWIEKNRIKVGFVGWESGPR